MSGHAICKDCGNGTMNNMVNTQFVLCDFEDNGQEVAVCRQCGGTHIDGELYDESDSLYENEVGA